MQHVIYEACIASGFVVCGRLGSHYACKFCLGLNYACKFSNYASDSLKISGNKTHFIQTEYFGKISGFFWEVLRVGNLSDRISPEVV